MMCENCFPMYFFEGGDLKIHFFLKFERCEHRGNTSFVDVDQEGVKCCLLCERPSEEGAPLDGEIELCRCSSCV